MWAMTSRREWRGLHRAHPAPAALPAAEGGLLHQAGRRPKAYLVGGPGLSRNSCARPRRPSHLNSSRVPPLQANPYPHFPTVDDAAAALALDSDTAESSLDLRDFMSPDAYTVQVRCARVEAAARGAERSPPRAGPGDSAALSPSPGAGNGDADPRAATFSANGAAPPSGGRPVCPPAGFRRAPPSAFRRGGAADRAAGATASSV